jgi:murein L,D-transpeptidase YcbB/YkuD
VSRPASRRSRNPSIRVAFVSALVALGASPLPARQQETVTVPLELKRRIDEMRERESVRIGEVVVSSRPLTIAVYESRAFEPLWNRQAATRLLEALAAVRGDGLDPEDYHLTALTAADSLPLDAVHQAELDILRTEALVRVGHDLRFGKVVTRGPIAAPETEWPQANEDGVAELVGIVASANLRDALNDLRPQRPAYAILVRALADLRSVRAEGGWPVVPSGPTLQSGDRDERVPLLRRRLALERYLPEGAADTDWAFDAEMETAVRDFQRSRALEEDGVVGESTLDALNVPVDVLVDRLRVNLERLRWVAHALPDTFVEVNAASAMLRVLEGRSIVFESRVIVGAPDTPTPVIDANILHVTLNPAWTVPPGIVGEVLAAVRRDPDYLRNQGIRIIDSGGQEVDPALVDLSRYAGTDFPYRFQQAAGPLNPLGRMKLEMPNPEFVYLHDTPGRDLFGLERRFLSHGCVRVEDPLGLATLVLRDPEVWSRAALEGAISDGSTRTIPLPAPFPVRVVYRTVEAGADGRPVYHPDTYGRDAEVLTALDGGANGTAEGGRR